MSFEPNPGKALTVECPVCLALPGQPCGFVNGSVRKSPHQARVRKAWLQPDET